MIKSLQTTKKQQTAALSPNELVLCNSKQDGQVENVETEVRKPKYRSEKKSCLLVFIALVTHECVCWGLVAKRWLYPCNVRAWSYIGSWTLVRVTIDITNFSCGTVRPKPRLTVSGPTMQALVSWGLSTVVQMQVLS